MDDLADIRARLYLDQDVPVQLAGMLRSLGIDALTTLEAGMLGTEDPDQLAFAVSQKRVLVTHNREDFETIHTEWLQNGTPHYGIIVSPHRRNLHLTPDRI